MNKLSMMYKLRLAIENASRTSAVSQDIPDPIYALMINYITGNAQELLVVDYQGYVCLYNSFSNALSIVSDSDHPQEITRSSYCIVNLKFVWSHERITKFNAESQQTSTPLFDGDDQVLVQGGGVIRNEERDFVEQNAVRFLHLKSAQWFDLPSFNHPRQVENFPLCILKDHLTAVGGNSLTPENGYTNYIEVLDVEKEEWTVAHSIADLSDGAPATLRGGGVSLDGTTGMFFSQGTIGYFYQKSYDMWIEITHDFTGNKFQCLPMPKEEFEMMTVTPFFVITNTECAIVKSNLMTYTIKELGYPCPNRRDSRDSMFTVWMEDNYIFCAFYPMKPIPREIKDMINQNKELAAIMLQAFWNKFQLFRLDTKTWKWEQVVDDVQIEDYFANAPDRYVGDFGFIVYVSALKK